MRPSPDRRSLGQGSGMRPERRQPGCVALPVSADQDLVLVVLGEVIEDLMPRSLRADEDVRRRLERWLVDE